MTREELTLKAIAAYNGNLYNGMTKALEAVVEMVLEEAARECEALDKVLAPIQVITDRCAAAIRALKG